MTTMSRTRRTLRTIFMFPAYTVAFALPVAALLVTFALAHAYCDSQSSAFGSGGICSGFQQIERMPLFQLP